MPLHSPHERKTPMTAPKRSIFGAALFLVLGLLLSGCRKDVPPPIPIGIGDGAGGADFDFPLIAIEKCTKQPSGKYYCPPSALGNIWMTTQDGMAQFSAWCYGTTVDVASKQLTKIASGIRLKRAIRVPLGPEIHSAQEPDETPNDGPSEPGVELSPRRVMPIDVPAHEPKEN